MLVFLTLLGVVVVLVFVLPRLIRWSADWRIQRRARLLAIVGGIGYGLVGRVVFGLSYAGWLGSTPEWLSSSFSVMSVSFLFGLPVVIGFVEQSAPDRSSHRWPWVRAFFSPMLPVSLMLGLMTALTVEGILCIAMALPLFLVLGGVGGLLGFAVRRLTTERARLSGLSFMLVLPYLAAPLEARFGFAVERREVHNAIHVRAAPSVVWREIKSVSVIQPAELSLHLSHLIGLPRPLEATLSHDGFGGVRIARFERGLTFRETVSDWQPGQRLSFAIAAEPAPRTALDEHVAVGGSYFDVLDGTYELVSLADGSTLLELTSHQRLSTHFNFYARLWTDFIMSDLQSSIMEVIRDRCEISAARRTSGSASVPPPPPAGMLP